MKEKIVTTVYHDEGAIIKLSAPQVNGVYQGQAYAKQQFLEAKIAKNKNAIYWLEQLYRMAGINGY
jgi:hypothetical protein